MREMRLAFPVSILGCMLRVSPSGYYSWVDRPLSNRAREELRLELEIKAAHQRTRQTYGPERLQHDLAEHGIRVGVCRLKRIRKKLGICCRQKRKFKATTDSRHKLPVAENLLGREFKVYAPDKVWLSDVTYVPTDERLVVPGWAQGPF
jgi:putative transposase